MDRFFSGDSNRIGAMCLFILALLVALAPLHTKILGAGWIFFFLWGMRYSVRSRVIVDQNTQTATMAWLITCCIALVLAWIAIAIWSEDLDSLNPQMRLALIALATTFLIYNRGTTTYLRKNIAHTLAAACTVAFIWTAVLSIQGMAVRENLASNAIPWAAAISFLPCLLLPLALTENTATRLRYIWLSAVLLGLIATILSQTRGVLMVLPWCAFIYLWFWRRAHYGRVRLRKIALISAVLTTLLLSCSWWAPGDPLSIHKTVAEFRAIKSAQDYNTSIGARLYIWDMALDGIAHSPWIGIGSSERKRRIENAGEAGPPEELYKYATVRSVGHVHNQYLNAALDGGMIGLAALVALLIGMMIATVKLMRVDITAAWQLGGVLLVHATTSITNVNFLHNYYVMALSLAAVVPFLCARKNSLS